MEVESAADIKKEPTDAVDFEAAILELCQQHCDGVSDTMIQTEIPNCNVQQRVTAVNRLLSIGKLDLLKKGNELIYKLKDTESVAAVKGSDQQERLIYQIIQEADNKGIWIRDIRFKSNLLLTQVNKILKNLESKKLVKSVKSVAASRKKVYMLYDLEPDRSITGGAWYSDQDFESEFVEVLNQQCFKFLDQKAALARQNNVDPITQRNASFASSVDIWRYISELGISKVELTVEDIETILETLVFDGKVERSIVASTGGAAACGQKKMYRAVTPIIEATGLMRMPCGACPVFDQCYEGGAVSPTTCIYMKEWLEI